MTADTIALTAGALISILASYSPKFNVWYASLDSDRKRVLMLLALVGVTTSAFALACTGLLYDLFSISITCERSGAIGLLRMLLLAIFSNQGAYQITPQTKAVKTVKALAKTVETAHAVGTLR